MNNIPFSSTRILLHSDIAKKSHIEDLQSLIQKPGDPFPTAICRQWVKSYSLYPRLARLCHMEYIHDLPIPPSGSDSPSLAVPLHLLVNSDIYVYKEKDTLYIATASPFISKETIHTISLFFPTTIYKVVLSTPTSIREAINFIYHFGLTISSQDRIDRLHESQSTRTYTNLLIPKLFPIGFFVCIILTIILFPKTMLTFWFILLNLYYFVTNPFKFYGFFRSLHPLRSLFISKKEISDLSSEELPMFTILVPLRNESEIIPNLIRRMNAFDYPKEKLDIKYIVDIDDKQTILSLKKEGIGEPSEHIAPEMFVSSLLKVPLGDIATKPRSCDYALSFARGTYTVIYDAEDKPDPNQLKKAYIGFMKSTLDTACIQARLNFYNSRQNSLTRLFSLEYGFWFDYFLVGLNELNAPIPLGGTSNHFVTSILRKVGTWDPFNVTEDADLGLRIFRNQYKTAVINSYTMEEANSRLWNWIRQRTRWQKGFLVTYLVHMSRPWNLIRDLGWKNFLISQLTFGANFFAPLLNPILWIILLVPFIGPLSFAKINEPEILIKLIALCNLIIGNSTYIIIHMLSSWKNKRPDLILYSLLLPAYWILLSVATIRAGIQFSIKPYYWEKTAHGLNRR